MSSPKNESPKIEEPEAPEDTIHFKWIEQDVVTHVDNIVERMKASLPDEMSFKRDTRRRIKRWKKKHPYIAALLLDGNNNVLCMALVSDRPGRGLYCDVMTVAEMASLYPLSSMMCDCLKRFAKSKKKQLTIPGIYTRETPEEQRLEQQRRIMEQIQKIKEEEDEKELEELSESSDENESPEKLKTI